MKVKFMADTNHKPGGAQDQTGELDRMLDAALAKYAAVEPRAGLEGRILANLRVEPARAVGRALWQLGLAGALAVIVIVAVLAWRPNRISHPVIAKHPPATIQRPSTQETTPWPHAVGEVAGAKRVPTRRAAARRAVVAEAMVAHPKLNQFPSPQPLSTEEVALAQYVKNFPKDAQLIAQAQEEFELETEKEMNDAGSETRPSDSAEKDSIQQER
jgi:hypothetical protein